MTYELCLELKNAGFPHEWTVLWEYKENFPTLSELIEACGEVSFELNATATRGKSNTWFAGVEDLKAETVYLAKGIGSTPEEAVARLWLQLKGAKIK